jgi:hypothetical protein
MRAHLAGLLALNMVSPAMGETVAGRVTVIDGDTLEARAQPIRLDRPDASESGQICDDEIEASDRCGVGTEWAITDRLSIKSEALYLHLQNDSRIDHLDPVWVGRIGVKFKLDGREVRLTKPGGLP